MKCLKIGLACSFMAFTGAAMAQENPGGWRIEKPETMAPGEIADLRVVFEINSPWQMYAPSSVNDALGVTGLAVSLDAPDGLAASQPEYPRPSNKGRYEVYDGPQVAVPIRVRTAPDAGRGKYTMRGHVQYQFCKPDLCLPPQRDSFAIVIDVE